jgi:hypothetical protein
VSRSTSPISSLLVRLFVPVLALLAFGPDSAHAQAILGQALKEGTGEPVEAALVLIIDEAGEQLGGSLTDANGRFRVALRRATTFYVRVERIGFETVEKGPFNAQGTGTLRIEVLVPETAIELEGIVAEADRQCVVRPGEGEATAQLWDEIRKALTVTELATQEKFFRFEMISYSRELNRNSLDVLSEQRRRITGVTDSPIRSLDADDLSANGYVRYQASGAIDYFGPDANVLLSDRFLGDHCWRIRAPGEEAKLGLVGLAFEPVERGRVSDIEGVMWVEQATGRLLFLEYRFTELPEGIRDERVGGRVEFEELPNGAWIVRRWWIRMPQMAMQTSNLPGRDPGERELIVAQLLEEGAEVTAIDMLSGENVRADATTGGVEGVVFDSLNGGPMPNARVIVSGTQFSGITDNAGTFLLEGIPDGNYTLAVVHPDMIARKIPPVSTSVGIRRGTTISVELGTPSRVTLEDRYCRPSPEERDGWPNGASALAGSVRDRASGGPLGGSRVRLIWDSYEQSSVAVRAGGTGSGFRQVVDGYEVETDGSGTFRVCGLPPDERITLQVLPAGGGERPIFETPVLLGHSVWAGIEVRIGDAGEVALGPGAHAAPGSTTDQAEQDALLEARRQELMGASTTAPEEVEAEEDARPDDVSIEQLLRRTSGIRVRGSGFSMCVEPSRGRGSSGFEGGCAWPLVVVDGVQSSDPVARLQSIPVGDIESIRFMSLAEAGTRFGTGTINGALVITTRSARN